MRLAVRFRRVSPTLSVSGGPSCSFRMQGGVSFRSSLPLARLCGLAAANDNGASVPISITIDATGADAAGLARVEQKLGEL